MKLEHAQEIAKGLKSATPEKLGKVIDSLENDKYKLQMDIGGMNPRYDSEIARPLVKQLENVLNLISTLKIMKANAHQR